jgi:hypothetical protein
MEMILRGEMVGAFRDCGVETVDGRGVGKILDDNKGVGYSHSLDVVPISFEHMSGNGTSIVSIKIEYRLYDWNARKIVWKAKDTLYPNGRWGNAKYYGRYVVEKNIVQTFDEKGFIALGSTKKEELVRKYGPEALEKASEKLKCIRERLTFSCAARLRSDSVDADENCKQELRTARASCGS